LSTAPQPEGAPALSYIARHSIKTDYEVQSAALLEKARKALHNPKFEFDPGFEAQGLMLKGNKDARDDWETNLGSFVLSYFESFVSQLETEKFGEDDLLREGLEEACPKNVIRMRLVEKLSSGYNEILLEDGALVIQVSCVCSWGASMWNRRLTRCRLRPRSGVLTSTTLLRSWSAFCSWILAWLSSVGIG
jgi:hypothetical protein